MNENELILSAALGKFGELLSQSEERIGRTNEMISSLAETSRVQSKIMNDITEKYMHHIDSLVCCRDRLIEQNGELLRMVSHSQERIERGEERMQLVFDKVIDKLNSCCNTSKSEVKIV